MAMTAGETPLEIKYTEKIPSMDAFANFTWLATPPDKALLIPT
jgi:hypothetical protein